MSDQAQINAYASDMAALKAKWPTMTADQRREAMQDAVDKRAAAAGFPSPKIKLDPTLGARNGELHFGTWNVAINDKLAANNNITDSEFEALSNTIYHETRHGEQWYLIARRDAAEGLTPQQIMAQRGINNPAIAKAACKNPLNVGDAQRAFADVLHKSVYGADANARNATLGGLSTHRAAVDSAAKKRQASIVAYKSINSDPSKAYADKLAAYNVYLSDDAAYKQAVSNQAANYAKYRALPEEADAWDAGDRAGKAVASALSKKGLP